MVKLKNDLTDLKKFFRQGNATLSLNDRNSLYFNGRKWDSLNCVIQTGEATGETIRYIINTRYMKRALYKFINTRYMKRAIRKLKKLYKFIYFRLYFQIEETFLFFQTNTNNSCHVVWHIECSSYDNNWTKSAGKRSTDCRRVFHSNDSLPRVRR